MMKRDYSLEYEYMTPAYLFSMRQNSFIINLVSSNNQK